MKFDVTHYIFTELQISTSAPHSATAKKVYNLSHFLTIGDIYPMIPRDILFLQSTDSETGFLNEIVLPLQVRAYTCTFPAEGKFNNSPFIWACNLHLRPSLDCEAVRSCSLWPCIPAAWLGQTIPLTNLSTDLNEETEEGCKHMISECYCLRPRVQLL